MTRPAEIERAAVVGAASLSLSLGGHLWWDGDGMSDEMPEAAAIAGMLSRQTLVSLVASSLDPAHLAGENDSPPI